MKIKQHHDWIKPALEGKKVNAIKALRGMTDPVLSLRHALYFIDEFMSIFPSESTSNKDST